MDRVVMFSGGVTSWAAAKRVAAQHGTDRLTLLFCDTRCEDPDLYRFLKQAAANVGGELVRLCEGRTIWEVFRDERYLGNSRVDPCSKILKRQMADRWLAANRSPESTVVYVGMDWTEVNRFERLRELRMPWVYEAPLCAPPYLCKADLFDALKREGIEVPRLYRLGFSHNNCGGGCVKAGIGHFTHLHRTLPEVFSSWEANEQALREYLGREDISILRDRAGGTPAPLTLAELRRRLESGAATDQYEIGGCGCFVDE
jgi:hypothetical protein